MFAESLSPLSERLVFQPPSSFPGILAAVHLGIPNALLRTLRRCQGPLHGKLCRMPLHQGPWLLRSAGCIWRCNCSPRSSELALAVELVGLVGWWGWCCLRCRLGSCFRCCLGMRRPQARCSGWGSLRWGCAYWISTSFGLREGDRQLKVFFFSGPLHHCAIFHRRPGMVWYI